MNEVHNKVTQNKSEFISGIMNGDNWVWNPEDDIYLSIANGNENQPGIALYIMLEDDSQELATKLLNTQFENPMTYRECFVSITESRSLVVWSHLKHSNGRNLREISETSDLLMSFYLSAKCNQ